MKKFIDVRGLVDHIEKEHVTNWIDRLSFLHIFLIWVTLVSAFGVSYHFFSSDVSYLYNVPKLGLAKNLKDTVYFSFVTATTTGFGDIIPFGAFKLVSIFEVISGLLLLAIVTSKLVSIKQDVILGEIYELSLNEKLNRLRSSLLLFRQNLDRVITKIEDRTVIKRELVGIYINLSSLEDTLTEILALIVRTGQGSRFIKSMDSTSAELLFNSIISSFEKIQELIESAANHGIGWKSELNISLIKVCIQLNEELFAKLKTSTRMLKEKIADISSRNIVVLSAIKKELIQSEPPKEQTTLVKS